MARTTDRGGWGSQRGPEHARLCWLREAFDFSSRKEKTLKRFKQSKDVMKLWDFSYPSVCCVSEWLRRQRTEGKAGNAVRMH